MFLYLLFWKKKCTPKNVNVCLYWPYFFTYLGSKTVFYLKAKKSTFKPIQTHLFCFNLFLKCAYIFSDKLNQVAGCLIGIMEPIVWFTLYLIKLISWLTYLFKTKKIFWLFRSLVSLGWWELIVLAQSRRKLMYVVNYNWIEIAVLRFNVCFFC